MYNSVVPRPEDIMASRGEVRLRWPGSRAAAKRVLFEMYDYFGELMRERRRQPQRSDQCSQLRVEEQATY